MSDSFVFYKSFYDAAAVLQPEDRLAFYDALAEYAICGEDPEPATPVAKAMFLMAKPQVDANERRREDGKKGGRPSKEKPMVSENAEIEKPMVSENAEKEKPMVSKNDESEKPNVNANANANANEEKKKGGRFTPPALSEIKAYCQERVRDGHPAVNPEKFLDYYEANGWKVGRNPMKDWKAAVRNWEQREKDSQKPEKPPDRKPKAAYFDIPQRSYDYAALERQILGGN